ncbi:glycosyltransferase family 2 protein [Candidatus Wolfebacteria bacterium]|nr:glycosyltransferase family 2 protein [Candidatus Wolfebacteria bacterium]
MLDLAIQIVNFRTKQYLQLFLGDIFSDLKNSPLRYEVLIVDNNSGDTFDDLQELYQSKPIRFLRVSSNRGFGAGHNFLAQQSTSAYILILNPDLKFMESNTIGRSIDVLRGSGNMTVAMGPKLFNKDGPQPWDHGDFSVVEKLFGLWPGSVWYNRNKALLVAWVSGAFLLTRRDAFEALGGFDENLFLYKEDEDLCLRLRERGCQILYDPAIRVFHHGSVVAKKEQFFNESNRYYIEKHFKRRRRKSKLIFYYILKYYFMIRSKLS